MGTIRLHPEKGVNAHLCMCPRCGEDNSEIVMLGASNKKITCSDCGCVNYGASWLGSCGKCRKVFTSSDKVEDIQDLEKIPGTLCQRCNDELKKFEEAVSAGGVYFRCKCGASGVAVAESGLAKAVREKSGIAAPNPVGVDLEECPSCKKENPNVG